MPVLRILDRYSNDTELSSYTMAHFSEREFRRAFSEYVFDEETVLKEFAVPGDKISLIKRELSKIEDAIISAVDFEKATLDDIQQPYIDKIKIEKFSDGDHFISVYIKKEKLYRDYNITFEDEEVSL